MWSNRIFQLSSLCQNLEMLWIRKWHRILLFLTWNWKRYIAQVITAYKFLKSFSISEYFPLYKWKTCSCQPTLSYRSINAREKPVSLQIKPISMNQTKSRCSMCIKFSIKKITIKCIFLYFQMGTNQTKHWSSKGAVPYCSGNWQ